MNSRSQFVRNIVVACCSWGSRDIVDAQNYVGGPVPLLRNPAQRFFKFLVVLNLAFLVLCILTFSIQQMTVISNLDDAA